MIARLLLLLAAALCLSANADETIDASRPLPPGVQVYIDEETGEVRAPTKEETAAAAEAFRRRYLDLSVDKPVVEHADGSLSQELGSRHRMFAVARIGEDGEVETQCLPAEQAEEFLGEAKSPEAQR